MSKIAQLRTVLTTPPEVVSLPDVRLRNYLGDADIERWLTVRLRSFARERTAVGAWTVADFRREFLEKSWWRPERMWFAESRGEVVGTVTLAERGSGAAAKPVVHWLAVLPRWRRRGVGRLLVSALHRTVWDAGQREILLETHADWTAAAKFYEALGYRPA
jgi:GNAT superfamily N-acetyltransferase